MKIAKMLDKYTFEAFFSLFLNIGVDEIKRRA